MLTLLFAESGYVQYPIHLSVDVVRRVGVVPGVRSFEGPLYDCRAIGKTPAGRVNGALSFARGLIRAFTAGVVRNRVRRKDP